MGLLYGYVGRLTAKNGGFRPGQSAQSTAPKKPIYLHYSASRHDHFSSYVAAPPGGYVSMGVQGYVLDGGHHPDAVSLAWYWSPEGPAASQARGDNVLAARDPAGTRVKPEAPTGCEHEIASAEACFAAARQMDGLGKAAVETSQGADDSMAPGCTLSHTSAGAVKAFFNTKHTEQCCGSGVTQLAGKAASLVDLEMTVSVDAVEVTLTGPSTVWFGAGQIRWSL